MLLDNKTHRTMKGNKECVRLRRKALASGGESLYLDIYTDGSRDYEFLKLYLVRERTAADRERNRETLRLAEGIKARRILEVQSSSHGFAPEARRTLFFPYVESMRERKSSGGSGPAVWTPLLRHMRVYDPNPRLTFGQVGRKWAKGFRDYLDTTATTLSSPPRPLARSTRHEYYAKFRSILLQAVKDGIIQSSPAEGLDSVRTVESAREHLTLEELRSIGAAGAPGCPVRRAFLFSCLTGLRLSDIRALTWGCVGRMGGLTRLTFRQRKTGGQEYLDIAPQAAELLGPRGEDREAVFPLGCGKWVNSLVARWMEEVGIGKHITFHCARHSFAVLMLSLGTDIYTVSKLLGHRSVATTQIYAKVVDRSKREAVLRIPRLG